MSLGGHASCSSWDLSIVVTALACAWQQLTSLPVADIMLKLPVACAMVKGLLLMTAELLGLSVAST